MNEVTEEELHAYVDGLLPAERRKIIEAYLACHPQQAARVAAWQRQKAGLHTLFDPVLAEPPPQRLLRRPKPQGRWRYAAAMAASLVVGVAAGWSARGLLTLAPPAIPTLPHEALVAHRVYSPEVLHPVEVGAEQEAHLVKWLSKRLGAPLSAPNLQSVGFQLVGGRLLPGGDGAAAQFMYQDARGQRLTLYLRRRVTEQRDTAFRYEQRDGLGVFYWVDGRFGYALSGELDRARLLEVARLIYRQLEN
jgi:anti-sigma factor RsiW